jgi:Caspase domain
MTSAEGGSSVPLFLDTRRSGPQTHVLAIGVGGYRYLYGGDRFDETPVGDRLRFRGLRQLSSPPRSALAFAAWIRGTDPNRWKAPLGTIDLLVSPAPGEPELASGLRRASLTNIRDAFIQWYRRCNTDSGNVAIFYFCGHGLQAGDQLLLAEDFGSPDDEWRAFAFETTRLAVERCRAQTQCFFIDACREVTSLTLETPSNAVGPLRAPRVKDPIRCRHHLTIQASAYNAQAFGAERDTSHFTRALLRAFNGGAAVNTENGTWAVDTGAIAVRIYPLLGMDDNQDGEQQRPDVVVSEPTALLWLTGPPNVAFTLDCDPSEAVAVASLACEQMPGGPRIVRDQRAALPWDVELTAGIYQVEAGFDNSDYQSASALVTMEPPATRRRLIVRLSGAARPIPLRTQAERTGENHG